MLIFTRKIGESLLIGDEVTITILDFHNNQIRLGINAPKEVEVHREEIYNRIQSEKGLAESKGTSTTTLTDPVATAATLPRWSSGINVT